MFGRLNYSTLKIVRISDIDIRMSAMSSGLLVVRHRSTPNIWEILWCVFNIAYANMSTRHRLQRMSHLGWHYIDDIRCNLISL